MSTAEEQARGRKLLKIGIPEECCQRSSHNVDNMNLDDSGLKTFLSVSPSSKPETCVPDHNTVRSDEREIR